MNQEILYMHYTRTRALPSLYHKQPTEQPLLALPLVLVDIPQPNRPMRRLDLDLITLPMIIQQPKVADKVPPRVAELAELRRTLQKRVAQLDTPMPRAEDEQARVRGIWSLTDPCGAVARSANGATSTVRCAASALRRAGNERDVRAGCRWTRGSR